MRNFIIAVLIVAGAYLVLQKFPAQESQQQQTFQRRPYVIVYGRDGCGWTAQCMQGLQQTGVPYVFRSVDDSRVANELHPRMQKAGLDTSSYGLPVVDVHGRLFIRPGIGQVASVFREGPGTAK